MIYLTGEKQRLDAIFKAFHDYISNHAFFDIIYSDKIGYFRVQVNDPEESLMVIRSVDKLLDMLFNDIIADILFDRENGAPNFPALSEAETEEARRRITKILETLGEDADYCLSFLDTYLEKYPDNEINDWPL